MWLFRTKIGKIILASCVVFVIAVITFIAVGSSSKKIIASYMVLSGKPTNSKISFAKQYVSLKQKQGTSGSLEFSTLAQWADAIAGGVSDHDPGTPDTEEDVGGGVPKLARCTCSTKCTSAANAAASGCERCATEGDFASCVGGKQDVHDYMDIVIQMRAKGYSDIAIAAALGSFVAESGMDPGTTQGHAIDYGSNADVKAWQGGKSGRAIGFAQWDGNRAQNLIAAADAAGVNWYDWDFQVNFYINELDSQGYGVSTANSHAQDVEHAAFWFQHQFERGGISPDTPDYDPPPKQGGTGKKWAASQIDYSERQYINNWKERLKAAEDFYKKLK